MTSALNDVYTLCCARSVPEREQNKRLSLSNKNSSGRRNRWAFVNVPFWFALDLTHRSAVL